MTTRLDLGLVASSSSARCGNVGASAGLFDAQRLSCYVDRARRLGGIGRCPCNVDWAAQPGLGRCQALARRERGEEPGLAAAGKDLIALSVAAVVASRDADIYIRGPYAEHRLPQHVCLERELREAPHLCDEERRRGGAWL